MRIRLILPRDPTETGSPLDFRYIARIVKGRKGLGCIPLALPTLAALTPPGVDVRITDENVEPADLDEPADAVGISYITSTAPRAYAIADAFRRRGVFVILGGFHATQFPQEALEHADAVAVGEAEETWPAFVEDLRNGSPREVYASERRPDLKGLVIPCWELVRTRRYYYFHVQATRGCRFRCDFCQVRQVLGPGRFKPVGNVLREIAEVRKLNRTPGRDAITFADDNIALDRAYAAELFRAMIPLGVSWTSQCALSLADDEELLDLAARSGCAALLIGFESISQASLDGIHKGGVNRVEAFRGAVERLRRRNINVFGSFVLGFDEEDPGAFRRTLEFVDAAGISFPVFHILTPIPGTPLYERLDREGRILHHDWTEYHGGKVCFTPRRMTAGELQQGYDWISRSAYGHEATFRRIERLWRLGALRGQGRQVVLRTLITLRLLTLLVLQKEHRREMRPFLARMIREMWARDGIAMGPLGVYTALFEYSRSLPDAPCPSPPAA